jgi:3-oxoacyl-(acyl-carrier-protein) synthase
MSINTPFGDDLDGFLGNLLQGRSAITRWKTREMSGIYSKVGGDLTDYDIASKVSSLRERIPGSMARRLSRLMNNSPWSTKLSVLLAMDAFLDGDLCGRPVDTQRVSAIVAGSNINMMHVFRNCQQYMEEPDYIDPIYAVDFLDTDHAACIADVLEIEGSVYSVGGACASGSIALRCAMDEIRQHEMDMALVVGAVFDIGLLELQGLAMLGAISTVSFNDEPMRASRPFDSAREGFVPTHGGAALVLEELDHALDRGARIYGELLGVEVNSAASRVPQPSEEHQVRVMERVLRSTSTDPHLIDFVSAHATSTPLGDLAEIRAIGRAFGDHARALKVNAPKSMLGHTCWSASVVETVAVMLQMGAGRLHPSINIDHLDPEIALDVCANKMVEQPVRYALKNSFGFGGINASCLLRRYEE